MHVLPLRQLGLNLVLINDLFCVCFFKNLNRVNFTTNYILTSVIFLSLFRNIKKFYIEFLVIDINIV